MSVEVGQPAPDFRLRGPGGQYITLGEFRGKKNVVLVFYPLDFSPICSHQLPSVEKDLPRFEQHGAQVLGISVDSHYAHEAFSRQVGVSFPLLSDLSREVTHHYGVRRREASTGGRAIFVIDRQGVVRYKHVSPNPGDMAQIPSHSPVFDVLATLS